eukprot:jgi/Mesvir1/8165/Mv25345-RA.1
MAQNNEYEMWLESYGKRLEIVRLADGRDCVVVPKSETGDPIPYVIRIRLKEPGMHSLQTERFAARLFLDGVRSRWIDYSTSDQKLCILVFNGVDQLAFARAKTSPDGDATEDQLARLGTIRVVLSECVWQDGPWAGPGDASVSNPMLGTSIVLPEGKKLFSTVSVPARQHSVEKSARRFVEGRQLLGVLEASYASELALDMQGFQRPPRLPEDSQERKEEEEQGAPAGVKRDAGSDSCPPAAKREIKRPRAD